MYAFGLHDPQEYVGDFKGPSGYSVPLLFLLSFLLTYCFPQLLSLLHIASGHPDVQQLSLIVFDRYTQE